MADEHTHNTQTYKSSSKGFLKYIQAIIFALLQNVQSRYSNRAVSAITIRTVCYRSYRINLLYGHRPPPYFGMFHMPLIIFAMVLLHLFYTTIEFGHLSRLTVMSHEAKKRIAKNKMHDVSFTRANVFVI